MAVCEDQKLVLKGSEPFKSLLSAAHKKQVSHWSFPQILLPPYELSISAPPSLEVKACRTAVHKWLQVSRNLEVKCFPRALPPPCLLTAETTSSRWELKCSYEAFNPFFLFGWGKLWPAERRTCSASWEALHPQRCLTESPMIPDHSLTDVRIWGTAL